MEKMMVGSSQGTKSLYGLPKPSKEHWEKFLEEMINYKDEGLTSEEFERKYPRTSTPYERQRRENVGQLTDGKI